MDISNHTKIVIIIAICLLIVIIIAFLFRKDINYSISKRLSGDPLLEVDVYNNIKENNNNCGNSKCVPKIPEPEVVQKPLPNNIVRSKEVFNVSKNMYTYHDSDAVCKALNSRVATFDEVQKAYENGADWCNYGWTKGQLALYPTQKSTWKKLQKSPKKYRNECGQPGVNGGYFDNPYLKFGVNCYGYKPEIKESDRELLNYSPAPRLSEEEKREKQKIRHYRGARERDELTILPFKKNCWNKNKYLEKELEEELIEKELGKSNNLEPEKYIKNSNINNTNETPVEQAIDNTINLNNKMLDEITNSTVNVNNSLQQGVNSLGLQYTDIPNSENTNLPNTNIYDTNSITKIPNKIGMTLKNTFNNVIGSIF